MAQEHSEILVQPGIGVVHDQIWTEGRCPRSGLLRMAREPPLDLDEPAVELVGAAAIRGWKRADHTVAAGGRHELDPRHQEHRRGDQWQTQPCENFSKSIGTHLFPPRRRAPRPVC
jgi:hypothetical protein